MGSLQMTSFFATGQNVPLDSSQEAEAARRSLLDDPRGLRDTQGFKH